MNRLAHSRRGPRRMHTIATIEKLLADLGTKPDEVAIRLLGCNVRGVRNTARFLNPIVRYLQINLQDESAEVDLTGGDRVRIARPRVTVIHAPLPPPVAEFLTAFHSGQYPSLELPKDCDA